MGHWIDYPYQTEYCSVEGGQLSRLQEDCATLSSSPDKKKFHQRVYRAFATQGCSRLCENVQNDGPIRSKRLGVESEDQTRRFFGNPRLYLPSKKHNVDKLAKLIFIFIADLSIFSSMILLLVIVVFSFMPPSLTLCVLVRSALNLNSVTTSEHDLNLTFPSHSTAPACPAIFPSPRPNFFLTCCILFSSTISPASRLI